MWERLLAIAAELVKTGGRADIGTSTLQLDEMREVAGPVVAWGLDRTP